MNYFKRGMLALAKTGDTEMLNLFQRFSARLNIFLTPAEIDIYARYLLAPGARTAVAPATFAEQAVNQTTAKETGSARDESRRTLQVGNFRTQEIGRVIARLRCVTRDQAWLGPRPPSVAIAEATGGGRGPS